VEKGISGVARLIGHPTPVDERTLFFLLLFLLDSPAAKPAEEGKEEFSAARRVFDKSPPLFPFSVVILS